MSSAKAKEAGDNFWDEDAKNPRVTSASLIVPKDITRELFHPDGRISDKRLETIQYKCFCQFRLAKLPSTNPGNKVCDRIVVSYSYPTKNHQVTLRLFNDLVQQCASALRIASLVKVSSVMHKPPPPPPPPRTRSNAADAAKAGRAGGSAKLRPDEIMSGDGAAQCHGAANNKDQAPDAV